MNPVIQAHHLNKTYGSLHALNNLSFSIENACCYGFLGPNGAGKSTLMKLIYGKALRDHAVKGDLSVFGFDPQFEELEVKTRTGVVPQEDNLDMELNVFQNLMIFSKFYGLKTNEAQIRIEELLTFMELNEKKKSRLRELSGGMKRRLTIARALLNRPRLLILDEPTTGLDPQVRHLIWEKLRQLKKEGVTILLTTHYMEEAFQICDRILIMDKGSRVMEGKPQDLLERHIEKYVLEVFQKELLSSEIQSMKKMEIRQDQAHSVVFLYSNHLENLKQISETLPAGQYTLRQSNLEDLFLKTTGRSLNEVQ